MVPVTLLAPAMASSKVTRRQLQSLHRSPSRDQYQPRQCCNPAIQSRPLRVVTSSLFGSSGQLYRLPVLLCEAPQSLLAHVRAKVGYYQDSIFGVPP